MEVFPKIAKFILVTLILAVAYLFTSDFGKLYATEHQNYFIARNSGDFVAKFTASATDVADYELGAINEADAKKSLKTYFDLQYENMGYEPVLVDDPGNGKFKAVYKPKDGLDTDYRYLGPIYVRAFLTDFNAGGLGNVELNIEQKVPAGIRSFMIAHGLRFSTTEDPVNGIDFEGYKGFYSLTVDHTFNINIVN